MNTNPVSIVTGVAEEVYEYLWKIENFVNVQQLEHLINQQKIEVETGRPSCYKTKWMFALVTAQNQYREFWATGKLLNVSQDGSVSFKIGVFLETPAGSTPLNIETPQTRAVNVEFGLIPNYLGFMAWANKMDKNGALCIKIKLTIFIPIRQTLRVPNAFEKFKIDSVATRQDNFGNFVDNAESADVRIQCSDGVELKAHKFLLSAQCPVFTAMFASGLKESSSGIVQVDDICGKTMKLILQYLYTGVLHSNWCDEDTIVEFTYAAGKYQLKPVLDLLDNVLGSAEEGNHSNIMLLNLSEKLSLKNAEVRLMSRVIKFANEPSTAVQLLKCFESSQ